LGRADPRAALARGVRLLQARGGGRGAADGAAHGRPPRPGGGRGAGRERGRRARTRCRAPGERDHVAVSLKILPGVIVQRDEFLATHPPYSIALDGYVSGEPFLAITPQGPYRNFNHHESVDRSCTSATCEQVRRAVILGLYDLYQGKHGPRATLWVNDCDQDV